MKSRAHLLLPVPAIVLLALAGWYFGRGGFEVKLPPNESVQETRARAPESASAPERPETTADRPERAPEPRADRPTAEPAESPALHAADHGERIWRGGARVDFELYDAAGNAAPAGDFLAVLWRQVGRYWVANEASAAEDKIICEGLGHEEAHSTGLEPGWYELELLSNNWGNLRHRFHVSRGDRRTERLITPNTRRVVCVRYLHPDGNPVKWLPNRPTLTAQSVALEAVSRDAPYRLDFRSPPTAPLQGGGGGGWRGGRGGRTVQRESPPTLYATDEGRWWFVAYIGAQNSITARLDADAWGAEQSVVTESFLTTAEVVVTLPTPADFEARALAYSEQLSGAGAGNRLLLNPRPAPKAEFHPTQAPDGPQARLTIMLPHECEVDVQVSADGTRVSGRCHRHGRYRWQDVQRGRDYWFRFIDGPEVLSDWEPFHGKEGLTLLERDLPGYAISVDAKGLSPTLEAFAHAAKLTVTVPKPPPASDPKIAEDATDEEPVEEFVEAPHPYDPSRMPELPSNKTAVLIVPVSQSDQGLVATRRVSEATRLALQAENLRVQTIIMGACQLQRPASGSYSSRADTPRPYTHDWLAGGWVEVKDGRLELGLARAFVLRAVGPSDEGLPWVRGLIMEHAHDEVAQQVRRALAALPPDRRPDLRWDSHTAYAARLSDIEKAPGEAGLRELLGEAYDLLETDEQRLWLARNGAWYEAKRQLRTDLDGYMVNDGSQLEPGKTYVLYLWSNSRDDAKPDRRVVFKAESVTDLGAIALPGYVD
ncbi:MAG: hypothetical protein KF696_09530 [Planctomycetes bacterium]|nr:hypothetical protein [Planctomycetota bacterium]MCW8136098.1 hypothetical protein [Planctomycetota bacterium]